MKTSLKVPRLLGLTELAKAYNLVPNDQQKHKIKQSITKRIIENYIQQGFTVLGIPTSIPELCNLFSLSRTEVLRVMTRTTTHLSQLSGDTEAQEDTYKALLALTLENQMALIGAGRLQTLQLQRAKGNRLWVQGLDRDLTNSIMAEGKQGVNTINLLKHLSGRDGMAPNIQLNQNNLVQNQAEQGTYIGPDEAIMLIDKQSNERLLESGTQQQEVIALNPQVQDGPEIIATKQTGLKDDGTFAGQDKAIQSTNHEEGRDEDKDID